MLPRLIVDKSALQMLGAPLMGELTLWFDVVTTPVLWQEIIGNLAKEQALKKGKRPPRDVLQTLATLLASSHVATPASFKMLALNDINGRNVEMNGVTVPVDSSAANVHSGSGWLVVEGTLEQQVWKRWSQGQFNDADFAKARMVRNGIERLDPKAIGESNKAFARRFVGDAHDMDTILQRVNERLSEPEPMAQARLMDILIAFLDAHPNYGSLFAVTLMNDPTITIGTFAPYATSILRLYLVFMCALALGIVKRDANSFADLQQMFYTPFSGGFASNDNLHRRLFPATSGPAIFVPAAELKDDLEQRLAWRSSLTFEQWREHRREYDMYPREIQGSIVNAVWAKSYMPRRTPPTPEVLKGTVDRMNEDPDVKAMTAKMHEVVELSRKQKAERESAWPLGSLVDE